MLFPRLMRSITRGTTEAEVELQVKPNEVDPEWSRVSYVSDISYPMLYPFVEKSSGTAVLRPLTLRVQTRTKPIKVPSEVTHKLLKKSTLLVDWDGSISKKQSDRFKVDTRYADFHSTQSNRVLFPEYRTPEDEDLFREGLDQTTGKEAAPKEDDAGSLHASEAGLVDTKPQSSSSDDHLELDHAAATLGEKNKAVFSSPSRFFISAFSPSTQLYRASLRNRSWGFVKGPEESRTLTDCLVNAKPYMSSKVSVQVSIDGPTEPVSNSELLAEIGASDWTLQQKYEYMLSGGQQPKNAILDTTVETADQARLREQWQAQIKRAEQQYPEFTCWTEDPMAELAAASAEGAQQDTKSERSMLALASAMGSISLEESDISGRQQSPEARTSVPGGVRPAWLQRDSSKGHPNRLSKVDSSARNPDDLRWKPDSTEGDNQSTYFADALEITEVRTKSDKEGDADVPGVV